MLSRALVRIQNRKSDLILLLILVLVVVFFRLPSLEEPFDQDSAAIAYGARLIVQNEPLYTSYHPGHHLPAIYYTYALAFSLFGDRLFAVKFFLTLWMIPTAYLFHHLACRFTGEKGSWLAVVFFLLLTSERWLKGTTAEIELFANLPRIGATLLLITLLKRNAAHWQFSFIGLIGAVSVLFKVVYVSPLVLTGIMLLVEFWPYRRVKSAALRLIRRILWMGVGFVVGLLPVIIYFGAMNLLPRMRLVFTLGQGHVGNASASLIFLFLYPLIGLGMSNLPILIMGLTGAMLMLRDRSMPALQRNVIPLWLLLSFVEAGFSRKLFLHYYLLIVPPLSLLAAWLITRLHNVGQTYDRTRLTALAMSVLLLLFIGTAYVYRNGGYLYHFIRYKIGQETYRAFVLNAWPPDGPILVALQDIANYVQAHSAPDDRIYIWSDDVQLYYLANRRCALDFIWPIYLESPAVPGGPEEMRRRLFAPTTKFIIVARDNLPGWLVQGLAQSYRLTEIIGGREIYQSGCDED